MKSELNAVITHIINNKYNIRSAKYMPYWEIGFAAGRKRR